MNANTSTTTDECTSIWPDGVVRPAIPNDLARWQFQTVGGEADWCEIFYHWYIGESGQERCYPKPCESWDCVVHALERALRVLIWLESCVAPYDMVWLSRSDVRPCESVGRTRARIRKRAQRTSERLGRPVHYFTITRSCAPFLFVISTADLTSRGSQEPSNGLWVRPWIAITCTALTALALPGVLRVSGDTAGWNYSGRTDRKGGDPNASYVGAATRQHFGEAYERMADEIQLATGIRPERGIPLHPLVDPAFVRDRIRYHLRLNREREQEAET